MHGVYYIITSQNPEIIRILVGFNLVTIHNCSHVTSIESFFTSPEFDCIPIFKPYTTSPYLEIRLHAKFILSCLSKFLSEKEIDQLLQLTFEEKDSFLKALQVGITANNRQVDCDTYSFSVTEALKALNNMSTNLKNCETIIESDVVPSLAALLISGSTSEQKAGCELIWKILSLPTVGPKFKEQLVTSEVLIADCVIPLSKSDDKELKVLANCVLFSMAAEYEGTASDICNITVYNVHTPSGYNYDACALGNLIDN